MIANQSPVEPKDRFRVGIVPEWVVDHRIPGDAPADGEPLSVLLFDSQANVGTNEVYSRLVRRLQNSQAVQMLSQASIDFDPQTEELTVHSIAVIRNGQRREIAQRERFRLLQRETSLEMNIYDGRISALLLVEDVRVGDVMDVSYTLRTCADAFEGRFSAIQPLGWQGRVESARLILRFPRERAVKWQVVGGDIRPETTRTQDETVVTWEATGMPAIEIDESAPAWYPQIPLFQASDFESWREVAMKASGIWEGIDGVGDGSPEIHTQIEEFRAAGDSIEDLADAAIRFVQNEIRYLGLEEGIRSFIPESPVRVFARRFGDCKDKSLLLCFLLHRLGIGASPVLVSGTLAHRVGEMLPSPAAFDHMIVMIRIGDVVRYVDPTIVGQGGRFRTRTVPNFCKGLVIHPKTEDLIPLPALGPEDGHLTVIEHFVIGSGRQESTLVVKTIATGVEADMLRHEIAMAGDSQLERNLEEFCRKVYPGSRRVGGIKRLDDPLDNTLSLTEEFSLSQLATPVPNGRGHFYQFAAHLIQSRLVGSNESAWSHPFGLPFPNTISHSITVDAPFRLNVPAAKDTVKGPGFEFQFRVEQPQAKRLEIEFAFRNTADHVAATDMKEYMGQIEKVAQSSGYMIGGPLSRLPVLALAVIAGIAVAIMMREINKPPKASSSPGRTPPLQVEPLTVPQIDFGLPEIPRPGRPGDLPVNPNDPLERLRSIQDPNGTQRRGNVPGGRRFQPAQPTPGGATHPFP